MAKQTGLGDNLYIGGYDHSNDVSAVSRIAGGPAVADVTGINSYGMERIGTVRDGGIGFEAHFNPAVDRVHARLSLLPAADQIVTYCRGTALGGAAACVAGKLIDYAGTRDAAGTLKFASTVDGNGSGLEWARQLTAGKRTDAAATNGAGVDFGAATAFGLQAYLHVFAFTGTSVTVKLQESSDNGGADAWTDVVGGTFTAATAITAQRIESGRALAVERYLRVVTTGVFTNAVIAVAVVKNEVAVTF